MSTVSAGESGFGGGFGADSQGVSSTVAGATTFFVLVVSAICMWLGADAQRVLLTASLSMMLFALISYSPGVGVGAAMTYLALVGGIKRYMIPLLGYSTYDPLLLVGPILVGLFVVNRLIQRDIPRDTPLSKMILVLLIIMILEAGNPLQGGIAIGLSGILFYVVPMLWYYVGRQFGTTAVRETLMKAVVVVAVLGAAFGFYQQFFGFTEIERQWLAVTHNDNGLYLGGKVMRVFSFFSSFAEYAQFTTLGAVVSCCFMIRRNRMYLLPFAFLMIAVVLSSSRGTLLSAVAVCALIWAVQGRTITSWAPRIVVALIFGAAALYYGLNSAKTADLGDTTQTLVSHQAGGILAPLDKKTSTGSHHLTEVGSGIITGFRNPLGNGLGATTLAAGKFGAEGTGTEFDVSNIFTGCGFVGGLLYVAIIIRVVRRTLHHWLTKRDLVSLGTVALLIGSVGFWLTSGHYASTMMLWFLVGSMDRSDAAELEQLKKERLAAFKKASSVKTGPLPFAQPQSSRPLPIAAPHFRGDR